MDASNVRWSDFVSGVNMGLFALRAMVFFTARRHAYSRGFRKSASVDSDVGAMCAVFVAKICRYMRRASMV